MTRHVQLPEDAPEAFKIFIAFIYLGHWVICVARRAAMMMRMRATLISSWVGTKTTKVLPITLFAPNIGSDLPIMTLFVEQR